VLNKRIEDCKPVAGFGKRVKGIILSELRDAVVRIRDEEPAGWNESPSASKGTAIDLLYTVGGKSIAIETETSYMSASHDLLKLVFKSTEFTPHDYLAILVTHNLPWQAGVSGPQEKVYDRVRRRIESFRQHPLLSSVFGSINLALIGVEDSGRIVHHIWRSPTQSNSEPHVGHSHETH